MARSKRILGRKALFWIGSARRDLQEFPDAVKDGIGVALSVAQFGRTHPKAKPWKGKGSGVWRLWKTIAGHVSGGLHSKVRECCVCVACVSEEISEGDKNVPNRCGNGFSSAQGGKRGLRGALWQGKENNEVVVQSSGNVFAILVYRMLARSKHECVWRLRSIRSLRHVAYRKPQRHTSSTSISRRFLL
jgi:hypothetical protein